MHEVISRKNVYLLSRSCRSSLAQEWPGGASIRIDNFDRVKRVYEFSAAREVHSANMHRVNHAAGLCRVVSPEGDGGVDVLVSDAVVMGGDPAPAKIFACMTSLIRRLMLELVIDGWAKRVRRPGLCRWGSHSRRGHGS